MVISDINCNCVIQMFIVSLCYKNRNIEMKYYHSTQVFPIDHFDSPIAIKMNSKILAIFLVVLFGVVISAPVTIRGEFTFILPSLFFPNILMHIFYLSHRNNTLFERASRKIHNTN